MIEAHRIVPGASLRYTTAEMYRITFRFPARLGASALGIRQSDRSGEEQESVASGSIQNRILRLRHAARPFRMSHKPSAIPLEVGWTFTLYQRTSRQNAKC